MSQANTPAVFTFTACGALFASSEAARGRMLSELGENLAPLDYAAWETARQEFEAGARAKGYADPARLWQRTIRAGQEFGLIKEKPAATGEAAAKKAEQRTKANTAAKEAAATDPRTPVELRGLAAGHIAAGQDKEGRELLAIARAKEAAANKEAKELADSATKASRDAIKTAVEAMAKANDKSGMEMLARVATCLAQGQHAKIAKAIKGIKPTPDTPAAM